MPQGDCLILMGVGVGFVILGVIGILLGRHEENSYYNALSERTDAREFVEHWPTRPQTGALKIGGWIAIALGVVLVIIGAILWLLK